MECNLANPPARSIMSAFLANTAAARPAGVVVASVGGVEAGFATVFVKATPINLTLTASASKPAVIFVVAWGAQVRISDEMPLPVSVSASCPLNFRRSAARIPLREAATPPTSWL